MTDGLRLELDQAILTETEVGAGRMLLLSGYCFHPTRPVVHIAVGVCGRYTDVEHRNEPRPDLVDSVRRRPDIGLLYSGFWVAAPIDASAIGQTAPVTLRISHTDGAVVERVMGTTSFVPVRRRSSPAWGTRSAATPLVAICLCTYQPEREALRRQIDSIARQSFANWICVVSDDASAPDAAAEIERIAGRDPRFKVVRHATNVGFYRNFERCLTYVPGEADFVALADQDDCWYPAKLERLLQGFTEDVTLVYSDMRIVDANGTVISSTYWQGRKNEYQDLALLLVANTVTGAASLFRRELLDDALPFPDRIGDAFHDHWLACVALTRGRIAYIEQTLYDYYQYGSSVIGHCDFTPWSMRQRIGSLFKTAGRLCYPPAARAILVRLMASSLAVYRYECRRLELITATLKQRRVAGDRRNAALDLFGRGVTSGWLLLMLHARVLWSGKTTDDAELRLALGYFMNAVEQRRIARQLRRRAARLVAAD